VVKSSLEVVDLAIHTLDVFHVVNVLLLDRVTCRAHQIAAATGANFVPHEVRHDWRLHVMAEVHLAEHVRRRRLQQGGKGLVRQWCDLVVFVSVLLLEHLVEPDGLQLIRLEFHQLQIEWFLVVVSWRHNITGFLSEVEELGKCGWNQTMNALEAILAELIGWCAAAEKVERHCRLPIGHLLGVSVLVRLEIVTGLGWVAGILDEPLWATIGLDVT